MFRWLLLTLLLEVGADGPPASTTGGSEPTRYCHGELEMSPQLSTISQMHSFASCDSSVYIYRDNSYCPLSTDYQVEQLLYYQLIAFVRLPRVSSCKLL